jgi:hypothetical protein
MIEIKKEIKTINGAEILCLRLFRDGVELGSMQQAQTSKNNDWEEKALISLHKMCGINVV